jgi:phosphatidate cytidylyltransferase
VASPDPTDIESPAAPSRPGVLTRRILSALVMMPIALAAVWYGSPFLPALVVLAGAGMGWEWARMSRVSSPVAACLIIAAPALAALALAVDRDEAAVLIALGFAICAGLAEWRLPSALWCVTGTLWIALPCVALLWIDRGVGNPAAGGISGRALIFWLFAIAWSSDVGAYAFGRTIGGPKLAPVLSPNKTWAGALGGLVCVALAGAVIAELMAEPFGAIIAISLMVAVAAQLGDLAESAAKRRFGVKDSSQLIPGHGGLLDRLDSLLTGSVVLAILLVATGLGG